MTDQISPQFRLNLSNLTLYGKECMKERRELRQFLTNHFSMVELKTVCFDLGIDFEEFGDEKSLFVIKLIIKLIRKNNLYLLNNWLDDEGVEFFD